MKKLLALYVIFAVPSLVAAQTLTCSISTFTNPSCNAGCNGSATVSVSGGTPPYNIVWQPGNLVGPTITNLCAGSYTCTVTDQMATVCSSTITLVAPPALSAATSTTSPSTCSACDGQMSVNAVGGTPPYAYCWNNCVVCTAVNCPMICAGTYTVEITDVNGCTTNAVAVVNPPSTLTVSAVVNPTTICAGGNVAYVPSVTGGTPPYVYSWSFQGGSPSSSTTQYPNVSYFATGNFTTTLSVSDAAGCTGTMTMAITVGNGPTVTASGQWPTCNNADGSGTVVATGNGPFAYAWLPMGGNNATATGLAAGTYTVTVTDVNGCTAWTPLTLQDSCDYVWPGDANDDAIADNIDILDIGIANGATGTTRANASLIWIGQPSVAWGQTLASGTDYKWVDCDGNGAINPTDTQAVVLNYGMTHNNRYGSPVNSLTAPDLVISFDQDSVESGATGTISLSLGDAANPAVNVYGLAFRLNYDAAQMNTSSFGIAGGTTWFGTPGGDMMRVVLHPSPANGYVDVAITRYDQQNVSGFGMLGQIYFTATNTLNGTGNAVVVPMSVSNAVLVDNAGSSQPVNAVNDSVVVADSAIITTVPHIANAEFEIYPNPASDNIQVIVPENDAQIVTIEDLTGRIVYSGMLSAGINTISVSNLPVGAYLIRIGEGTNSCVEQITITR